MKERKTKNKCEHSVENVDRVGKGTYICKICGADITNRVVEHRRKNESV